MATKIPIGTSAYFTDFDGGQGGGAANYFTYAADFDTNFKLLRTTVNQIIDEVSAVSGPNATIALDVVRWEDDANPIDPAEPLHGVLGAASYEVSVEGGGTLKIRKGQCLVNLQKCTLIADLTGITSSGGAGTRWVALDANGIPYIESAASQRSADLATVTWDGAQFTAGTVVHLMAVLFDGDSWAEVRDRAVTPDVATFAAYTFRRGAERIRALELFLAGQDTGAEGEDIDGPLVLLPGAAATPSIILGDGSTTFDTTSGWYRPGSGHWGFSSGGVLRYTLTNNGIVFAYLGTPSLPALRTTLAGIYWPATDELAVGCEGDLCMRWRSDTGDKPQALVADGDVSDPGLGFDQEENTGWYRPGAGQLAAALAGVQKLLLNANSVLAPDGVVGTPAFGFLSEAGLGIYRLGTDRLGFATADTLRAELDAEGNLDLPTNMGAIVRRAAAQTAIVTATPTNISWDTEDRDIGGWIAVTATDLVVPTGGDGLYAVTLEVEWSNEATPTGYREIWVEAAGTAYGRQRHDYGVDEDFPHATSTIVPLVATDVVRGVVEHTQGANSGIEGARLAIQKIA